MEIFAISISSPPDRDKLVAEVFFDNIQWIELNQENGLSIEFYPRPDGKPWIIEYSVAIQALMEAKNKLVGS